MKRGEIPCNGWGGGVTALYYSVSLRFKKKCREAAQMKHKSQSSKMSFNPLHFVVRPSHGVLDFNEEMKAGAKDEIPFSEGKIENCAFMGHKFPTLSFNNSDLGLPLIKISIENYSLLFSEMRKIWIQLSGLQMTKILLVQYSSWTQKSFTIRYYEYDR